MAATIVIRFDDDDPDDVYELQYRNLKTGATRRRFVERPQPRSSQP
jgi:hypothetical protein